jgi:flagellar biosynthesis protein FlhB
LLFAQGRYTIPKTNKTASALAYDPAEGVPRLVASGRNREAERIIALAREAGILVVEEPGLALALEAGVKPGDYIPIWCWEAAAKILAFVLAKESQ